MLGYGMVIDLKRSTNDAYRQIPLTFAQLKAEQSPKSQAFIKSRFCFRYVQAVL